MNFIKGFFLEGTEPSMMRLCFFLSTLGLIGLTFYIQGSEKGWDLYNAGVVTGAYGLIFGAKAFQKQSEVKENIEELRTMVKEI